MKTIYFSLFFLIFTFQLSSQKVGVSVEKYVVVESLSLREKPNTESPILEKIPYNSRLKILGTTELHATVEGISGKWVKVKSNFGKTGFVFDGYLVTIPPPPHQCKSLEQYANLKFSKKGKLEKRFLRKTGMGDEFLYSQDYNFDIRLEMEKDTVTNRETLILKGIRIEEGFLIGRMCGEPEFKNIVFKYNRKNQEVIIKSKKKLSRLTVKKNVKGQIEISLSRGQK